MSGRHGKPKRSNGVTNLGPAFAKLAPANKAEEFDASFANPVGYALRNFIGRPSSTDRYDAAHDKQRREQEDRRA